MKKNNYHLTKSFQVIVDSQALSIISILSSTHSWALMHSHPCYWTVKTFHCAGLAGVN